MTKPELAQRMLSRPLAAGRPSEWFAADDAYGDNSSLWAWLEDQHLNYVMASYCDQRFSTPTRRLQPVREAAGAVGAAEFCDRFDAAARVLRTI